MSIAEQENVVQNFRAIADAIATLFFPHAEVVLHDLRTQRSITSPTTCPNAPLVTNRPWRTCSAMTSAK